MPPLGSTAMSKQKPSYHPRLLPQPMFSAHPARAIHAPGAWPLGGASPSCPGLVKDTFAPPVGSPGARLESLTMTLSWEHIQRLNCERSGRVVKACLPQVSVGVAVEVPLAGQTGLTREDSQGEHLALGEGCLRERGAFLVAGTGRSRLQ
jgi:hypothetical protein